MAKQNSKPSHTTFDWVELFLPYAYKLIVALLIIWALKTSSVPAEAINAIVALIK